MCTLWRKKLEHQRSLVVFFIGVSENPIMQPLPSNFRFRMSASRKISPEETRAPGLENWLREIVENAAEIEEYKIRNGKNGNRKIGTAENTKSEIGTAENTKSEIPKNENRRIGKVKWKIRERERERERETYLLLTAEGCDRESRGERKRKSGGESKKESILFLFPTLPSLTWMVTWHRMSSFAVHVSLYALLAVDLDNSKGGSGFGRFSKGHDVW